MLLLSETRANKVQKARRECSWQCWRLEDHSTFLIRFNQVVRSGGGEIISFHNSDGTGVRCLFWTMIDQCEYRECSQTQRTAAVAFFLWNKNRKNRSRNRSKKIIKFQFFFSSSFSSKKHGAYPFIKLSFAVSKKLFFTRFWIGSSSLRSAFPRRA